jgi:hypothetical protein
MILDQQTLFSDSQAITGTANGTNVIDDEATGAVSGAGDRLPFFVMANAAFAGGTSLQVSLVSADDIGLTLGVLQHLRSPVIPLASLTKGATIFAGSLPTAVKTRRYVGVIYTVVGAMTAGAVTAAFVADLQGLTGTTGYQKGFDVL